MIIDETMRLCMKQAAQIAELKRDVQELREKLENVPRDNQLAKVTEHCLNIGKSELAHRIVTDAHPRVYESHVEPFPVWRARAVDANKIPGVMARVTVCNFVNDELFEIYSGRKNKALSDIESGYLCALPDPLLFVDDEEEEEEEETDEEE